MSLKKRLGRLKDANPDRPAAGSLAALRGHLQAAMPQAAAAPPIRHVPTAEQLGALGFVRQEGPLGGHFVRRESVTRQTVGAVPLRAALALSPRILSLLALDPGLAGADWDKALYLDTETTGLGGGAGTYAFLVGLCFRSGDELVLEQLFLGGPEDEASLLESLHERLSASSLIVSFNGKSYDMPLLEGRFVLNRRPKPVRGGHFDLLHVGRRVHAARLTRATLQHLEREVLGFLRVGDVAGAEVAERYTHYLRSGDTSGLQGIVEHNGWDVVSMVALTALYGGIYQEVPVGLEPADFVGYAKTFKRAGAFDDALGATERAILGGASAAAHRVRGEVFKALGERDEALDSFQRALRSDTPAAVRLELAKLYEHHLRDPAAALAFATAGTGESAPLLERRIRRLQRKAQSKKS